MYKEEFISYIKTVRRYSERTCALYEEYLGEYLAFLLDIPLREMGTRHDEAILRHSTPATIRAYETHLLDERALSPRTVNLHMSVLNSFYRYLVRQGVLKSNPAGAVPRPKVSRRLPDCYRRESMEEYFRATDYRISPESVYKTPDDKDNKIRYDKILARTIISTLYTTGIRRSELIGLKICDLDYARMSLKVHGKGDKTREIPLLSSFIEEISLYLQAVETMVDADRGTASPLFVTFRGSALYPELVDRTVKSELETVGSITGRKSPHVLRHTLATELLDEGSGLNSIKEMLGHSSLAATQVYTHNSIARLKTIYESAHPRARKNGGKNGD